MTETTIFTGLDSHKERISVALAETTGSREVRYLGEIDNTAAERGGVTPSLVREVRARLDLAGFKHVEITITGGLTPERIGQFIDAESPVQSFGVGAYIASAAPNPYTADIHEVDGRPMAKRGRTPGITLNPRLDRTM